MDTRNWRAEGSNRHGGCSRTLYASGIEILNFSPLREVERMDSGGRMCGGLSGDNSGIE